MAILDVFKLHKVYVILIGGCCNTANLMEQRYVNQFGGGSIYIEENNGTINYFRAATPFDVAVRDNSYELEHCTPDIEPKLVRPEVGEIVSWIDKCADKKNPNRVALVYGMPGIGKTAVMNMVYSSLKDRTDYLVWGIKADRVGITNMDALGEQMRLSRPLLDEIREAKEKYTRVVLLIDQIDALSQTLSSNRTAIRSMMRLIGQLKTLNDVRVVVSCRPYDLEYDPELKDLHVNSRWEIKELPDCYVSKILSLVGCDNQFSAGMLRFLGNPLHLCLFLKLKDVLDEKRLISVNSLYDELWKSRILHASDSVDGERLLAFIDELTSEMYDKQVLSAPYIYYETKYNREVGYLQSNGFISVEKERSIQFYHQTLFDYAYARRFVEKHRNLQNELCNKHQGLFVRSKVKTILDFYRSYDESQYIETVKSLLLDNYRFHIKSLVLTNMAYQSSPLNCEVNLIRQYLFANEDMMSVLLNAIHSSPWLDVVMELVDESGGWISLNDTYKSAIIDICGRMLWSDGNSALRYLRKICEIGGDNDVKLVKSVISYSAVKADAPNIKQLYLLLKDRNSGAVIPSLLCALVPYYPELVVSELIRDIDKELESIEYKTNIRITDEIRRVYKTIEKNDVSVAMDLYIKIYRLICEKTAFSMSGYAITQGADCHSMSRITDVSMSQDLCDFLPNRIIDFLQNKIDDKDNDVNGLLYDLVREQYDKLVFIGLYVYTHNAELFKDDAYYAIVNLPIMDNAPVWVEYQACELLKSVWEYLSIAEKERILDCIVGLDTKRECSIYFQKEKDVRLEYGVPLTFEGYRKGILLSVIPESDLRNVNPYAWHELCRLKRKYKHLENSVPFKMSSMSGWPSVGHDKSSKMDSRAWYNSMKEYSTDSCLGWERPTLTGQRKLFEIEVTKRCEEFIPLINEIISDESIHIGYCVSGMSGLIAANRLDLAEDVFNKIVEAVGDDVNTSKRGFDLHSFLFAIEAFFKSDNLPDSVFDFLCRVVENADDSDDMKDYRDDGNFISFVINRARGNAVRTLIKCENKDNYRERIFPIIESIASSASVATRGAALMNLALLNRIDQYRNIELFKALIYDYDPLLLSMPVHNLNPLVYFVKYAFDELGDFFEHVRTTPECYNSQIIILWLAWYCADKEAAKEMIDEICSKNLQACRTLIEFIVRQECFDDKCLEYLYKNMDRCNDDESFANIYDGVFLHIKNAAKGLRIEFAWSFAHLQRIIACHYYLEFLASLALSEPHTVLELLVESVGKIENKNSYIWNTITDVIIQSYNGIKSYNDPDISNSLEKAMDLLDQMMEDVKSSGRINYFIQKLDNE